MHEHIKVSHEKDSFVKRLIHVLKESSARNTLKTVKNLLMLQVWKFLCATMAKIFTTSQHVLRVLQTSISSFTKFVFLSSLAWEEGEASSALFLEIEVSDPFVGENAQITGIYG